ncbi:MAG: hypothetical protein KKI08_18915 [Armatimonadetes bacterium]|nr:hypothetical protein [Armatimonadota bacterium]
MNRAATVTPRALVIGLALAALNAYWVVLAEVRWGIMDGSCLPLFITPVFFLFGVALLNVALRRCCPKWGLTPVEMLTIYIVIVVAETLAAHDLVQNLFGAIGHATWSATPENKWDLLFHEFLPRGLVVSDPTALRLFYEGEASFLDPRAIGPFLGPLAGWAVMLAAMIGVMLAFNVIIRRQWINHERLTYPLVVLPVEMTRENAATGAFFADRLLWGGFALAALIDIVNGLNVLHEAVPKVPMIKLTWTTAGEPPWVWLYRFNYGLYPFAVALAFFLPSDLSFSCWFFFLVSQLQFVAAGLFGLRAAPPDGFPYVADQASGAWLALALGALATSRPHFARVWAAAWGKAGTDIGRGESRRYRMAFIGGGICLVILGGFFMAVGMGLGVMLAFMAVFFLLSIAITRVRAELGTPHEIYYINPQRILVSALGARGLGAHQLTALSVVYWFNRGYRSHPMPFQLESMKMADLSGMDLRALVKTLIIAAVLGIIMAYWANAQITFREGAQAKSMAFKAWVGNESYTRLASWLNGMPGPKGASVAAMGAGGFIFWALRWVHFNTPLPLHPAGYALANSFAMNYFWNSFLIGWLVKTVVLRYGGRHGHQHAFRFFLGLLLGDYVFGSLWGAIGPLAHIRTYKNFI